jgi:hypothetical protein
MMILKISKMKAKTLKSIRMILHASTPLPILDYFYIDKEFLYFSNLEIFIKVRHKFPIKEGSKPIVVRADHFIRRLEHIRAPFSINADELHRITIDMPESETMLAGNDGDFPLDIIAAPDPLKSETAEFMCHLSAYEIGIMNIARGFIADNELRPIMAAVCLSKDYIVASDTHMLYYKQISQLYDGDIMFDSRVIKLMMLFPGLTYSITKFKRNFCAESKDVTIWWREVDGHYPNWKVVVQDRPHKVIIPVKETIAALDAISFAANEASHLVKCYIKGDKLRLLCTDIDFSISAFENVTIINTEDNEIEFGMKLDFLRKELKILLDEGYFQVEMKFEDTTRSFIFADQLLLMPIAVNM